jgi:predicted dipeptidase
MRLTRSCSATFRAPGITVARWLSWVLGAQLGMSAYAQPGPDEYRVLGEQTRATYAEAARQTLAEWVAMPTFHSPELAQHNNPAFHEMAEHVQQLAEKFGLPYRNIDHRVWEIRLPVNVPDSSAEIVALHAHADVVPADAESWLLVDGTQLDPWTLTTLDGRMYGRGAEDNKNGIVAVMYAMKAVKDAGLPVRRDIRLLVDTTEETTGEAMPYYLEHNPMPDFNIALDGGYPVIIAEKGYGTLLARFPARAAIGEGAEISHFTGSLAGNQIPGSATATLLSDRSAELAARLEALGAQYVAGNGSDFAITATAAADRVELRVTGVSAHASEPWTGVNPVPRMFGFLYEASQVLPMRQNHLLDAVLYAVSNFGLDYTGRQLGIAFSDSFMGPLTASLTYIETSAHELQVVTNLRVPVGRSIAELTEDISQELSLWSAQSQIAVLTEVSIAEPMYRNPEGAWINVLLDVATENLGLPREFLSSDGATSIHDLPNGVQFGLAMPGIKYTGHTDNEFKTIEQFDMDLQIVTEMIARIAGLESMF